MVSWLLRGASCIFNVRILTMYSFYRFLIFLLACSVLTHAQVSLSTMEISLGGHTWKYLPSDADINQALDAFKSSQKPNVTVTSGPIKMHGSWGDDCLMDNHVFVTVHWEYSDPQPDQDVVAWLIYDMMEQKWKFEHKMHMYVDRYPDDGKYQTSSMMIPEDMNFLQGGWYPCKDQPVDQDDNTQYVPPTTDDQQPTDVPEQPDPEDPDVPWTLVIGGVAAVTAAVIGLTKILKGGGKKPPVGPVTSTKQPPQPPKPEPKQPPKSPETKKKEPPKEKYILQLSTEQVTINANQTGTLEIKAWKVTEKGTLPASDAAITLEPGHPAVLLNVKQGWESLKPVISWDTKHMDFPVPVPVTVWAQAGEHAFRASFNVVIDPQWKLELSTTPDHKTSLRPDSGEKLEVWGRVTAPGIPDNAPVLAEWLKLIEIEPSNNECDQWIRFSHPFDKNGWRGSQIECLNPAKHLTAPPKPPQAVMVRVRAERNKILLSEEQTITILAAEIDAEPDQVNFSADLNKKQSVIIRTWIKGGGEAKWNFEAAYKDPYGGKSRALTTIKLESKNDTEAEIVLEGPIVLPPEKDQAETQTLIISAAVGNETPLERYVKVTVAKEGLYLKNGLNVDGKCMMVGNNDPVSNLEFALYVLNPETGTIEVDEVGLQGLRFEMSEETSQEVRNVISVAAPDFRFMDLVGNIPLGRYHTCEPAEIPGVGTEYVAMYKVTTPAIPGREEPFEVSFPFVVKTWGIGPDFPDWLEAYHKCQETIAMHVPNSHFQKFNDLLEKRKMTLGAEGLNELRKKIWRISEQLILAEGAEGYKSVDRWASAITEVLEWTEWVGDLCFAAVSGVVFGPWAPAANIIKSLAKQTLRAYQDGLTAGEYLWQTVTSMYRVVEGRMIDVEALEKYLGLNKRQAWAAFVGVTFLAELYRSRSAVQAFKDTLRNVRDELIVRQLSQRVMKEAGMRGIQPMPPAVSKLRQKMRLIDGKPYASMEDVLEIMRHPDQVRSLKNAPDDVKTAFENTRSTIYKNHDENLRDWISAKYGIDPDMIKVDDFRTPGADGKLSLNTDRDYRVLVRVGTKSDGTPVYLELPKEKWVGKSYDLFGQITNKPPDISNKDWAEKHQQLGTDKSHIEASPDYSDQAIGPEGTRIQVKPNIVNVENGVMWKDSDGNLHPTKLIDPDALGNMYAEKVDASIRAGNLPEAFAQCKKGVETLVKVRKGYNVMGLQMGEVPDNIIQGMDIIRRAPVDHRANPEAMANINQQLNDLGFSSITDFTNKMASQFSSLKWAK